MADDDGFGRLLASGPLPLRGPRNVSRPRITLATPGQPVGYETGTWAGRGDVSTTTRVFAQGAALSADGSSFVPRAEDLGRELYAVETARDRNGIPAQITSEIVRVRYRRPGISALSASLTVLGQPKAPTLEPLSTTLLVEASE